MKRFTSVPLAVAVLLVTAMLIAACGSDPTATAGVSEDAQFSKGGVGGAEAASSATPRPKGDPAPSLPPDEPRSEEDSADEAGGPLLQPETQSQIASNRIIIRTVDMTAVVTNVAAGLEAVAGVARDMGGWVLSSEQATASSGSISIRVPAERLDETLPRLRGLVVEVEAETSTSQDVTAEFVDTESRVRNLEKTSVALLGLLERAENVEEALAVQNELTRIQEQIEVHQGRLNFLSETSAFSLINVRLKLSPADIQVDAGEDITVKAFENQKFQASFWAPAGIERFRFSWDFGDGSQLVTGTRTIEQLDGNGRVTDTVNRQFRDTEQSPLIVTVTMTGEGPAGAAEGEDKLLVTVLEIPTIEAYAGQDLAGREGEEFVLTGSFTRPTGLTDFKYRWDFGDGSESEEMAVPEGETKAVATHVYADHRPQPYRAALYVTATSEAGEVEQVSRISVSVEKGIPWVQSLRLDQAPRVGVLVVTTIGQVMLWALAAVALLSPLWIPVALVLLWSRRRARRRASETMVLGSDPHPSRQEE